MRPPASILLAAGLLACAAARPLAGREEAPPLLQLPEDVRPLRYALAVELVPSRDRFRGEVAIEVELSVARRVLWLHARDLHVTSAEVETPDGGRTPARLDQVTSEGVARLALASPLGPGRATLRFAWDGAWGDTALAGLYRSRGGQDAYVVTQFEAIAARRAFPCFDEPRFKTPFEITLTVAATDTAVSNAPVASQDPLDGGLKRVRFAPTRPLPTYLVFLGTGPFDVVSTTIPPNEVRATPLALRGLAPRGRGKDLAFGLQVGSDALVALERWFGSPYPYEKLDLVAASSFAWGGMENAGAILLKDRLLLFEEGRSDEGLRGGIATVLAHEISHQWFGDSVTLPWWTDTWLNESFAELLGSRIASQLGPQWGVELDQQRAVEWAMRTDALSSARAIRQPLERTEEIGDLFDELTYDKGEAVLRSFARWMGEDRFQAGLRRYVAAHAYGIGSTEDLLASLSEAAGRDLATPFRSFIDQPGVPLVAARVRCGGGGATVALSQGRYRPRGSSAPGAAWQVPVCIRYGVDGPARERCMLVPPGGATLELGAACPAWVFPDAGGTGYYRWTLAPEDLARLRAAGPGVLSAAERLSLARAVRAAQRAGALPFAEAMDTLAMLARDPDDAVAGAGMDAISELRRTWFRDGGREPLERAARALYRPVVRGGSLFEAAAGETEEQRRLRVRAVEFLAVVARDPEVRAEAARRGRAFAGLAEGEFQPAAVSPDLAAVALEVAVEDGGADLYAALLARLGTTSDGAQRHRILQALAPRAGWDGPDALWRDPRVLPGERLYLLAFTERPDIQRHAFQALRRELDQAISLVPSAEIGLLPEAAAEVCDAAGLEEARFLLEPAAARHPEMRMTVANVLEGIRLCLAERAADGAAAGAWFQAASSGTP
jgi:alanyl aminopeptidase